MFGSHFMITGFIPTLKTRSLGPGFFAERKSLKLSGEYYAVIAPQDPHPLNRSKFRYMNIAPAAVDEGDPLSLQLCQMNHH
jgi:hypothetical protein